MFTLSLPFPLQAGAGSPGGQTNTEQSGPLKPGLHVHALFPSFLVQRPRPRQSGSPENHYKIS